MERMRKRRGFTLIEVIVALGILMIVVLALVSSYYSYYNSVKQMTYTAIGQNLAEVLLEDARSLQVGILDSLVNGGKYPTAIIWQTYKHSTIKLGCYEVCIAGETPDSDIPDAIPYPLDITFNPSTGIDSNPYKYDSGTIDSAYRLEKIETVLGVTDSGVIDPNLLKDLPGNIIFTPVYYSDTDSYDYTIALNKETFPYYKRRIVIIDLTPNISQPEGKIYKIEVTVSWEVKGIPKSITLTTEKSFKQ